jgi:hypothetical protein
LVKNSLPKPPLAKSKVNERKFVNLLTGRTIGVPTKNYKRMSNSTGLSNIPVRFYIYAKLGVSVVIGKLGRFLTVMHYYMNTITTNGSPVKSGRTM